MSRLSFKSFCIEYYAEHIGKPSNEVYLLFKKEKQIDLLESDCDDLLLLFPATPHSLLKFFLIRD